VKQQLLVKVYFENDATPKQVEFIRMKLADDERVKTLTFVSEEEALVINVPSEPYNHESPDEYRAPWDTPDIPYSWDVIFK